MAKKRAVKRMGTKGRTSRKESYTSERLSVIVERMREQAARMAGLARAMDDSGVKTIVVDGHAMLLRGLNQVDNFADNASRAVREEKTAKEQF